MPLCLVVDDASVIRRVAGKMLQEMDFRVTEADNGLNALAAATKECPDVMLLDWNMPVMDGLECLQKLRESPLPWQPKVIFCTTENSITHIHKALAAGADEYIMKPFDSDILRAKLEQIGAL
jgi:two-component system, chemotaxis family, chemotaxis protein CheY